MHIIPGRLRAAQVAGIARVGLVALLALAACKDQALFDQDAGDALASFDIAPPLDATVVITEPEPGGLYVPGDVITFRIGVTGFELVEPAPNAINERGRGHWLVTIDDPSGTPLLRGATQEFELTVPADVPNGDHELVVSLREKNGDPTGVEGRVAVTFEGGIVVVPDAGGTDAGAPDAGGSEDAAGGTDAGPTDATAPDTADAAAPDAGSDAGLADAGPADAGPADAGADTGADVDPADAADGGAPDAAPADASPADAGPADASSFDATTDTAADATTDTAADAGAP